MSIKTDFFCLVTSREMFQHSISRVFCSPSFDQFRISTRPERVQLKMLKLLLSAQLLIHFKGIVPIEISFNYTIDKSCSSSQRIRRPLHCSALSRIYPEPGKRQPLQIGDESGEEVFRGQHGLLARWRPSLHGKGRSRLEPTPLLPKYVLRPYNLYRLFF